MSTPSSVSAFLKGKRFAVAGVSRRSSQPANAVFRKLRDAGYEVVPVNPNAGTLEGTQAYPTVDMVPGSLDGVVIATHPNVAIDVVRDCAICDIERVWFHRAFGQGSISSSAVHECHARGIEAIVGGCPLMFCRPVDPAHACMRWWLQRRGRVPQ